MAFRRRRRIRRSRGRRSYGRRRRRVGGLRIGYRM